MEWKTDALMLGGIDYKDHDKLLTLFTAERGIVFTGIKGVRKPNAKLAFAAQPFAFAFGRGAFLRGERHSRCLPSNCARRRTSTFLICCDGAGD